MSSHEPARILRFDRYSEGDLEWFTQEDERRRAALAAEKTYAHVALGWTDGRFWLGLAKEGQLGPYAVVGRGIGELTQDGHLEGGTFQTSRYVPSEQPKTPREAIAAVLAEAAREVALHGEPDNYRRNVIAADGDGRKVARLLRRAARAEGRLISTCRLTRRSRIPERLCLPVWKWWFRRLCRKVWTA